MIKTEDRFAILEVIAQYSYTYDARDADGFASLFTDDAVWELYLSDQAEPDIELKSQEEIREWAANRLKGREGKINSRHHQSSTVFRNCSADYAETRTMILVTHHELGDPHPIPTITGEYQDIWKKTTNGWKFAKRVLQTDKFVS
jgi:ketosteroid isomerase-like protein